MNMVKALVAALVLVGSVAHAQKGAHKQAPAASERTYGQAGCGLGNVIFHGKGGGWLLLTNLMNGIGSQSSAVSSGSSGCRNSEYADTKTFIDNNAVALENDVVRGQGEALQTLSKIMSCDEDILSVTLKNNYKEIYSSKETSTQKVMDKAAAVCSVEG